MDRKAVNVGLIGLGTVGTGVVKLLMGHSREIALKLGVPVLLAKVAEKDISKHGKVDLPSGILTVDAGEIMNNPAIDIVVEVIGGIDAARKLILEALGKGKNVVTANKDLLAVHGRELFEAAARNSCDLFFEASVGGGIPIITPLKECLAANRIEKVTGIVNGTTNYILTKMGQEGASFADVLSQAQAMGYAEANPSSDIDGLDAARKIAILASIAFNTRVTFHDVYAEGISKISATDITYAKDLGYVIKLLAIGQEIDGEVEARVHPALIPNNHPLASVHDVFNAIMVRGDFVGDTMFYGRGAGEKPTASAIAGDIMAVARNIINNDNGRITCTCFENKRIKPITEIRSRYYMRLQVKDRPGVLSGLAGVFGNQEVGLSSVIQTPTGDDQAEIVLITHQVREQNLQDALCIIEGLSSVIEISSMIRVEGWD